MAVLSEIDKLRKARRRKAMLQRFFLLLGLTILGLLVYIAKDQVNTTGFTDFTRSLLAGISTGPGYPLEAPGGMIRATMRSGNNLMVLTDSNLYIYNGSGKMLRNVQHKYSDPAMRISGSRILLYDRGGKRLRVESLTKTIAEKELDYAISACAISSRGEVAVASGAPRYAAQVEIFDQNFLEGVQFTWKTHSYVTSIDFSDSGRTVAAAATTARDGELVSSVHIFRTDSTKPRGSYEFSGQLIHAIEFGGDGVLVVTDEQVVKLDDRSQPRATYNYQMEQLTAYSYTGSGDVALLFGDYREDKTSRLVLLGSNCEEQWGMRVSSHVELLSASAGRISIVADGKLRLYNMAGEEVSQKVLSSAPVGLQQIGSSAYVVDAGQIAKYE